MNTKRLFLYLPLLLALMIGSVGCSKDDDSAEEPVNDEYPETTFFITGEEVPVEIWSTDEMPEWMAETVARGTFLRIYYGLYDGVPVFVVRGLSDLGVDVPAYEFYSQEETLVMECNGLELEDFLKNHTSGWKCIAYNKALIDSFGGEKK